MELAPPQNSIDIVDGEMQQILIFYKAAQLGLTFVMAGIQGVQRALKIGSFGEKIHYAVLKNSGQYLKLQGRTLQEIFTCQLYDYAIRKFMSISQLEEDIRVTEIQFWSVVGINFIKEKYKIRNVSALTNSQDKANRAKGKMKDINVLKTDYSNETTSSQQDIFLYFHRTREQTRHKMQIDFIKILSYIKKNLNETGYAAIGSAFTCEGDLAVFEELLDGFGFKIQMKENITPNIELSRKVLGRIYKNRLIAWALGKVRETINEAFQHDNLLCSSVKKFWKFLQEQAGIEHKNNAYYLFILEHSL